MHQFSLDFLFCVGCNGKLELEILEEDKEIHEGFLRCHDCSLVFPIVMKIPILWNTFDSYLKARKLHGNMMYHKSKNLKLKSFIKKALLHAKSAADKSGHEQHWANVYLNSKNTKFYSVIKNKASKISTGMVLEHGCSNGLVTKHISRHTDVAFGIDQSFAALLHAKQKFHVTADFFVSDSLNHPFGNLKFDTVISLNLLDIVEPKIFLSILYRQFKGFLLLSTPYDDRRGSLSVRHPLNAQTLRNHLCDMNLKIISKTKNPSFIPWNLKINTRTEIRYKVDLIIAKKP